MRFSKRSSLFALFALLMATVFVSVGVGAQPAGAADTACPASEFRVGRVNVTPDCAWRSGGCTYVVVRYDPAVVGRDKNLRLLTRTAGGWQDITVSVDQANRTITGRTATVALGPVVTLFDDADPRISYGGQWSRVTSPDFSGGTLAYGSTGCEAAIAFTGTGVELTALTGPTYGIARVTLDSGETTLVDLYSPTYQYGQLVYSRRGLLDGAHALRIEHTGTKAAGSTATRINLDAVGVLGSLTQAPPYPARFEESDGRIAYAGAWTVAEAPDFSGGALVFSSVGCEATVAFTGTGVDLIALTGPTYGIARVTLDSGAPALVDLYAADYGFKQVVYSRQGLTDGAHTLRIEHTGTGNAAAQSTRIDIDAVEVLGTLTQAPLYPTRIESSDARIAYGGEWTTVASPDFSGDSLVFGSTGCTATVSFTGTGVDIIALTGPSYGYARVDIDGASTLVNLYSPDYAYKQVVFSRRDLPDAPHVLRIEHAAEKDAASVSTRINLDAIDIVGVLSAL
jgi:hypothetical protein